MNNEPHSSTHPPGRGPGWTYTTAVAITAAVILAVGAWAAGLAGPRDTGTGRVLLAAALTALAVGLAVPIVEIFTRRLRTGPAVEEDPEIAALRHLADLEAAARRPSPYPRRTAGPVSPVR